MPAFSGVHPRGKTPLSDRVNGLYVVEVLEAAQRSLDAGSHMEAVCKGRWSMFDILEHVTIAEPFTLDVNVLLGVQTGRHIADHSLWIGPNARIRSGTVIYGGSQIGGRAANRA